MSDLSDLVEINDTDCCCAICDYTVWEGEEIIDGCHAECYEQAEEEEA